MAKKAKNNSVKEQRVTQQPRKVRSRPLCALLLLALAILVGVAVFDYNSSQFNATSPTDPNLVGPFGSHVGFWGFHYTGIAAFLLPLYLLWLGLSFFVPQSPGRRSSVALLSVFSLLCVAALVAMLGDPGAVEESIFKDQISNGFGGVLGEWISERVLQPYLGSFGSLFVLSLGLVIGLVIIFTNNLGHFLDRLQRNSSEAAARFQESRQVRVQAKAEAAEAKRLAKEEAIRLKKELKAEKAAAKARHQKKSETEEKDASNLDDHYVSKPSLLNWAPTPLAKAATTKTPKPNSPVRALEPQKEEKESRELSTAPKSRHDPAPIKIISGEKVEKALAKIPERRGNYVFPPLSLLAEAPDDSNFHNQDHAGTMQSLVQTLDEFGVKVIPGEIHTGPVITRYEVTPAPGVRVEKIVNLDKNIALGLKALSVRILAPVPGKGTVGIEVPNKSAQAVCMRDIVESKAWAEASAEIPIVLGKDVTGKPLVADLTKMPHVLIAGSTGSGKTVCINAIIASLLYHSGPEDLRFIMVDPKVVEMQMYNALPHMLIPVVTEPKKVPGALKWLISEMEHRYQIFASENVRNIAGFNAKIAKNKAEQAKADAMDAEMSPEERAAIQKIEVPRDDDAFEIPRKKLPYIVCVIDELADLMMVAPADIETCIARLAQLARAAGIHLILATQRPSVNVITGVIKANLPSRISFKVASKVDSRTILDGGGAEALIGKGDMLFIPPGTSNLVRAQGAFVSDDEINAIVDFLKEQNDPPVFAEEVQKQIDAGGEDDADNGSGGDEGSDELFAAAVDVLRSTKRASTSMLQRRLRVGYNRAARLMEELEERGIVGPENGSSPREIMVDLDSM